MDGELDMDPEGEDAMGMDAEEDPGMEGLPEGVEVVEDDMSEDMINEVSRRVARRLRKLKRSR